MAVGEEAVANHIRSSVLGKNLTIAEEAIRRYGTTWPGLASMISDIRTVGPLLSMSRQLQNTESTFYVATEPQGTQRIADVHVDAEVFMRRYKHMSTEERRFNSAMEKLCYRFVYFEEIRKDVEPNTVLLIGQDTNPSIKYPNCDLWFMYDIVPRYARVD
ncbi:neurotactin-like [Anabrus simplex]|uniref:neurotactin-like n=1 Tax=Anabrus simplex TaxID=316456 RepID=UPI0035A2649F